MSAVDRFVIWLEKDRLRPMFVFLYVLVVALVRDFSEYFLLDQEFVTTPHPWAFSIAHHLAFYVVVFMGLIFLLTAFSGKSVRKITNFVCMFYWIVILPPWIDHYIGGLNHNYLYFSITDFLDALFHLTGKGFNIGQACEVLVVLFALFAYSIWTQRDRLVEARDRALTMTKIGLLIFFTLLSMFIIGTPASFLPVSPLPGPHAFPNFDSTKYYQLHLFLFAYYVLAGVLLAFATLFLEKRRATGTIFGSMRPLQSALFAGIVFAGIGLGWSAATGMELINDILATPYWVNLAFAGLAVISAVSAWQVSTIWNDLSDMATDDPRKKGRSLISGILSRSFLIDWSAILCLVSFGIAILLSVQLAAIVILILALSYIYSFPPFRFKTHFMRPMLIGLGAFLAFVMGYIAPYSVVAYAGNSPYLTGEVASASLSVRALEIGLCMFSGLVVGSMVTDVDGFEEDQRGGVRTFYTTMGIQKGARIVAALIFLVALTPILVFPTTVDVAVFVLLGGAASVLFYRYRHSRAVMAIAMVGLLYGAIRFLGLF
jgi:4-hydroxybenzoate polyprenyltransferase